MKIGCISAVNTKEIICIEKKAKGKRRFGLALVKKNIFKRFGRFDIINFMKKYFSIYFIVKLIEILHQNILMKDLSDKGRHGDFVFYWQEIGKAGNKCLLVLISAPKLQ